MPRYVSFLRGINVGKRRVSMARLCELYGQLGLKNVTSFIASGNLLFDSSKSVGKLESTIEQHLEQSLGYPVDTFIRTVADVKQLIQHPLLQSNDLQGITIHIGFLKKKLDLEVIQQWESIESPEDSFRVHPLEFFWLCRGRISDSKIWNSKQLKSLPIGTTTMRNLTSLRRLVESLG